MSRVVRWCIGGQVSVDGKHSLSYAHEVSEDGYLELQEEFRFLRELAQQDEFMRLLQCTQAWEDLLSQVVEEGAEDGRISPASQHKARRGLRALFHLTDEFLSAAELRVGSGDPVNGADGAIESFRGTDSFAQLGDLDKIAEAGRMAAEQEAARAAKERRQAAMEQHTQDFGSSISGVMASLAASASTESWN